MNNEKVTKFYNEFFKDPNRSKANNETSIIPKDVIKEIVTELKGKDQAFFDKEGKIEDNNLYKLVESKDLLFETKSIDNAFANYLKYFSNISNANYYKTMCKFVLMSRDFMTKGGTDTANEGASGFPDQCNDFVSEYLEKKKEFGLQLNETIDLVQHFCYWLHEKEYTKSVLTLLSYD